MILLRRLTSRQCARPIAVSHALSGALQRRTLATPSVQHLWRSVGAVCFDVDSTVIQDEGIDMLAAHCGAGAAVKEWTTRAMNGNVKFEDALAARLDIIKPSRHDISQCLERHPPALTPGIRELISALHHQNIEVFFVSGGFRLMIEPVAEQLNVPLRNIYANTIFFDGDGEYSGFDDTELTSRDGGKAEAVAVIKKTHGHDVVAMVGDGVTDLQARPPADLFVGFGGVVARPVVQQNADWFVTDFAELTKALRC
ncbi:hypothetical protein P43SY_008114 [Pythium insidiosum]|uniref:phosphoserine phosphatase n=1 Tax=Pythium insidiosum TaxID=114742 RepID=A0AAD5Q5Y9_PYTIN|nr:hypothetical protein P43SY_008114 [Pythium insidiosum]